MQLDDTQSNIRPICLSNIKRMSHRYMEVNKILHNRRNVSAWKWINLRNVISLYQTRYGQRYLDRDIRTLHMI